MPPAKVEVAVEVPTIKPNCPLPPSTNEPERPAFDAIPPVKVEVAVEVEVMEPVVRRPVVMLEKVAAMVRNMEAKNEVEVALVVTVLVKVEVADEVAVMTPAVRLPIEEEETYELTMETIPFESMTNAVVVPVEGTATTWNRLRFESVEVALTVRTARGEVVPKPVRVAPAG